MKGKKEIVTAVLLSGSLGLGAQLLFAQGLPSGPSSPGQTGPTEPRPGPSTPQQMQPTIPGQPAPGLPQTAPVPGQPGTIPERVQPPETQQGMVISPDDIRKAQQALKAKGLNPGTDGRMDAKTQQALRDFQKANNLPVTGVLDEKTAAKLGVALKAGERATPSTPSRGPDSTRPKSNSSKTPGTVQ